MSRRLRWLLLLVAGPAAAQDFKPEAVCMLPPRRERQAPALPRAWPEFKEAEPAGTWGRNDTPAHAEWIAGTGADVLGRLSSPESAAQFFFSEEAWDDGAIPLAHDIGLGPGLRIKVQAVIGDGLHGSAAASTGDYDFYRVGELLPGQRFTAAISTPEGSLDTKIGLYDAGGALVNKNDNGLPGVPDSFLETSVAKSGDYFLLVRGINTAWPGNPFDPASGPKAGSEGPYELMVGIDAVDVDVFSFDAAPGDVISVSVEGQARRVTLLGPAGTTLMGANVDASILFPASSPLLVGGNANVARILEAPGHHAVAVESGDGDYALRFRLHRTGLAMPQVLFLDFDGAGIDARILGGTTSATLSPLERFLAPLGLEDQAQALMDGIVAVVEENLVTDFAGVRGYGLELRASHRHADPWGDPHASRIIVGGRTAELGIHTVGIAESVDVGNFVLAETAVVLLDVLLDPNREDTPAAAALRDGASLVDVLSRAIGNIASHEAGHLFANFHTWHPNSGISLMDGGRDYLAIAGSGPDGVFGTTDDTDVDFGVAGYREVEGFTGLQDSQGAIATGLSAAGITAVPAPAQPIEAPVLGLPYPHPARGRAVIPLWRARQGSAALALYDILGRHVDTLFQGELGAGRHHIPVDFNSIPAGLYLLRSGSASRSVMVVR